MRSKKLSRRLNLIVAVFALATFMTGMQAAAQTESILYNFARKPQASEPSGGLVSDAAGNFYGVTRSGGADNYGAVYELSPAVGGGWTEKVLHSFQNNGKDGTSPFGNLILDAAGNLYGTTYGGGPPVCSSFGVAEGCGTVFELTQSAGKWSEKILHTFNNDGKYGQQPEGGLIFDAAGNLYGTTVFGGAYGGGTAFELVAETGGKWRDVVLHSFGHGTDGNTPVAGLAFDAEGNLYGTTSGGGSDSEGNVFELTPKTGGGWEEKVVHEFTGGHDGGIPNAGLVLDSAGNLYGTTYYGGTVGDGTVFEFSPQTGGGWEETVLHSFANTDGANPNSDLVFGASGNLYGATYLGGPNGLGTVFELMLVDGSWSETVLYNFGSVAEDGNYPVGAPIFDGAGNLYGATFLGGTNSKGAVYEVTP